MTSIKRLHLKIGGMQCSFCTHSLRKTLLRMEGVVDVGVSLAHEEALIQYDPAKVQASELCDTVRGLGYTIRDPNKLLNIEQEEEELRQSAQQLMAAATITSIAFVLMLLRWIGNWQPWFPIAMFSLSFIMTFVVGWPILQMASASFRRRILNQHVLMEFGAIAGIIGGMVGFFVQPWPMADFLGAAIFITAYHILSGYISLLVRTKSSQAITNLLALQPATGRVIRNGVEKEVPVETVLLGEFLRVKPGESIPVDGIIVNGTSTVDQSLVTGEPIPVVRKPGDEVIGGSINQFGTLLFRVTKVGEESFLHQVAMSIQDARAKKPNVLLTVEKVLQVFVPVVLLAAGLAFLFWMIGGWLLLGEPQFVTAMFSTLSVLVMGYPCALGMATPLAMIRGGGIAAKKGILIRSGESYQVFKDVTTVVLDKTGTITEGRPQVVKIVALEPHDIQFVSYIAAAVETPSEHPLGRAIVDYAQKQGYLTHNPLLSDFQSIPGFGVKCKINNASVVVGNPRLLRKEKISLRSAGNAMANLERKSWTVVAVAYANKLVGLIAIADPPKVQSALAISYLKDIGLNLKMVTGDNRSSAVSIAKQVGITEVMAEVLPTEKAEYVRELQSQGNTVAFVGDGINDAPALKQADIGIAIGTGSDIAIESADVILLASQLDRIIDVLDIGKKSYGKTKQNVALAFAFNGIGVPLAMTGLIHPVIAMIAMVASVTAILINSFGVRLMVPRAFKRGQKAKKTQVEEEFSLTNEEIIYQVPSLHCKNCVISLTDSMSKIDGVLSIQGDPSEKTIKIRYDSLEIVPTALEEAIIKAGHRIRK